MAHVQFTDVQDRPLEFLDLTSLTLDEFRQLVPPFEAAFHAHMAAWRLDGKPRTARQFSVYQNCPLPTPEDRLLFPRSRGSGTEKRFLIVIQAKNDTNVCVWTKRSHMALIEALTCLTREDIDQWAYKRSCFLCL